MASFILNNSLAAIVFFTLIIHGSAQCSLNNINIGTVRSGRVVQGKPEWDVTVINNCSCSQSQIKLSCQGFQSSETVSPSILLKQGDSCLLINGGTLKAFASVKFSYAWDPPFILLPTSSVIGSVLGLFLIAIDVVLLSERWSKPEGIDYRA